MKARVSIQTRLPLLATASAVALMLSLTALQAGDSKAKETKKDKKTDEPTVQITGSRVPQKLSRVNSHLPTLGLNVVIITNDQLGRTGVPTAGGALIKSPGFR